jgi:hypothetical protein
MYTSTPIPPLTLKCPNIELRQTTPPICFSRKANLDLQSLLALRPAAAHAPGLRALQVSGGDPALVEGTSLCAASNSRAIGANDRDLVSGVDLLALAGGTASTLAAFAAAALLGEQGSDPGVIDEVADAAESGEEEKVEEDAVRMKSSV